MVPVRILPLAQSDVDHILDWMINKKQAPAGAVTWFKAYEAATKRIGQRPESFAFVPERDQLERDVQQCLFKTPRGRTYRCIFVVVDNMALVLRIRGPGQPSLGSEDFE